MPGPAAILVVDDEPNIRLTFRTALEAAGYRVAEAPDGAEALETLGGEPFQMVFLDLQMPRVDGLETLRRLREREDDIPVVIVTAHGSVSSAVEAMKLGAIDFLQKPVTPAALRTVAEVVLAGREAPGIAPGGGLPTASERATDRLLGEVGPLLEKAGDTDIEAAEAHYVRGMLLEMRGERDKAADAYRAALREDPDYGPARMHLRTHYDEA